MTATDKSLEQRLRDLEDKFAVQQLACGYGYAIDGCNAEAVGSFYAEDGVYAVADSITRKSRSEVESIASSPGHLRTVKAGCAHLSTASYVVLEGDRAAATCHTAVLSHRESGFFIWRLSASRIECSRKPDGGWEIKHRQNYLLKGDPDGPRLLARLKEGPGPA
jgi:hypothetical protein